MQRLQRGRNRSRGDLERDLLLLRHFLEFRHERRDAGLESCKQAKPVAGCEGFLEHRLVRLQYRDRHCSRGGFDGKTEGGACEEEGVRAALLRIARQRHETVDHMCSQPAVGGEVRRERIFQHMGDARRGP